MDRPEDKFTHEELVKLLQRSITLQERDAERVYTEEDLVAAAKELGVAPEVMKRAVAEHRTRSAQRRAAPRPFDTKIELFSDESSFSLRIPPIRPSGALALPATFTTTWLGFVGFWTWGASRASFFFAAFSLPFWVAGIGMAKRFFSPLLGRTTLNLERSGTGLLRTGPFGRERRLDVSSLRIRDGAPLVLDHGTETIPLLEGFSDAEVLWVTEELRAWLPAAGEP